MPISVVTNRFPDPVAFSRKQGGSAPPDVGDVQKPLPSPSPYVDSSGLALAKKLGSALTSLQTYAKDGAYSKTGGSASSSPARGSTVDVTA